MKFIVVNVILFLSAVSATILTNQHAIYGQNVPLPVRIRQLSLDPDFFNEYHENPTAINRAMMFALSAKDIPSEDQIKKCKSCTKNDETNDTKQMENEEQQATTEITKKTSDIVPNDSDDELDDEYGWPFFKSRNNAFFPIMFGGASGYPNRVNSENDGSYPSSATAIANSFSVGKGSIATSHANAFGNPTSFRNPQNGRKTQ